MAHTTSATFKEFASNALLVDSVCFRLIQIAENAARLSPEYKSTKKRVPWRLLSGLRNRIVHDYGAVDKEVVFQTAKEDMPKLLKALSQNEHP